VARFQSGFYLVARNDNPKQIIISDHKQAITNLEKINVAREKSFLVQARSNRVRFARL